MYFLFYFLFKGSTLIFLLLSIMLAYSITGNLQLDIWRSDRLKLKKNIFLVGPYSFFSTYIMCHLTVKPASCSHVTYAVNFRRFSSVFFLQIYKQKIYFRRKFKVLTRYGNLVCNPLSFTFTLSPIPGLTLKKWNSY